MDTISPDIIRLDAKNSGGREVNWSRGSFEKSWIYSGFGDRDAYMQQQGSTNVDTKLVEKLIKVLGKYFDEDGEVLAVWEKVESLQFL